MTGDSGRAVWLEQARYARDRNWRLAPQHARREGMRLRKQNILTIPVSFSRFAKRYGRAAPAAEPSVIHHTAGGHK